MDVDEGTVLRLRLCLEPGVARLEPEGRTVPNCETSQERLGLSHRDWRVERDDERAVGALGGRRVATVGGEQGEQRAIVDHGGPRRDTGRTGHTRWSRRRAPREDGHDEEAEETEVHRQTSPPAASSEPRKVSAGCAHVLEKSKQ